MQIDVQKFWEQGYLILKNVFSVAQVESFRQAIDNQLIIDRKKGLVTENAGVTYASGDLLSKELLREIFLDKQIIKAVTDVLGDTPIYFGDSSYQVGHTSGGYHRDNVDRNFGEGQDWQGRYDIVRLGIYFQDHKYHSAGLKIKRGTHNIANGRSYIVESEVGDVIIWNMRILHSGHAVRLKGLRTLPIDYGERYIPKFLQIPEERTRKAMFFAFGLLGKDFDHYKNDYMLKRDSVIEHLRNSQFDKESQKLANRGDFKLVKIIPEYGLNR
jgi:hypothetical protein